MAVVEGEAVAVAVGVFVGVAVAVAEGVGVPVSVGRGEAVLVGVNVGVLVALSTVTVPDTVVTGVSTWPRVSDSCTSEKVRLLLPTPTARKVKLARVPVPEGPVPTVPKVYPAKRTVPAALSMSGPSAAAERPVLPRKEPSVAAWV